MNKSVLNFDEVKDDFLSPGRILWQQKSGSMVLISAKGSFLNLEMIQKLLSAGHIVLIEDNENLVAHTEIVAAYHAFMNSGHIREKLQSRFQMIGLLTKYYLTTDRSQEDLDQLCWKLFSQLSRDEARQYLNRDINYFKRAMSVAGSYTLFAFLMGHYDAAFLNGIYTGTMRDLMTLGRDQLISVLKTRLEILRKKPHLEESDKAFVNTIVDPENFQQALLLEKFDGSGVLTYKTQDLNDLEIVLCSLNYYFHWNEAFEGKNVLREIFEGRFRINVKVGKLINRNFDYFREKSEVGAA